MTQQNGAPWEPKFGVPNGGKRPPESFSARVRGLLSSVAAQVGQRFDSWQNPVTGFGTTRDKTTHGYILPSRLLTDEELSNLYHHDDMAARMVNVVPAEMMREPFDVETGNVDLDAAVADKFEELAVRAKYGAGMRWGRAFGGGAVLIGADDKREAIMPLKAERANDIDYLIDVDKRYLWPVSYYEELGHPKFGMPKTFLVTTMGGYAANTAEVHESRLILFGGSPTAQREKMMNRGWDFSVMQRAYEILRQFNTGWQSVENMMTDGSQSVYKMAGLTELQSAEGGELAIQRRMRALDFYRSNVRAIVIDADAQEDFARQSTSFEQIPNVLDKFMLRLAATVEIPVTILMGQSPAGMNATGESDFRWFYDRIRAEQTTTLAPKLRYLIDVWLRTKKGQEALAEFNRGADPETINIKFPPLWTETPLAVAQRELAVAQKDQIYITTQTFTPEETALTRGRPEGFTAQIQLTDEQLALREEMSKAPVAGDDELGIEDEATATATPTEGEVATTLELALTPSDLAAITKVNEARQKYGLAPLAGADGQLTLPAFKAKYATVIAEGAQAEAGIDPNEEPAPAPAGGGFGSGPPPGAAASAGGDAEAGAPDDGTAEDNDAEAPPAEDEEFKADTKGEYGGPYRIAMPRFDAKPRTFVLQRDVDESGVSGTGEVAHGVLFDDGKVCMRWRTKTAATTIFDSLDHVLEVHGHKGKTRIVWDDVGERTDAKPTKPKRKRTTKRRT